MDLDFLLIRKMKQGDEEAFDLFVHKYYKDILSFCNYHCFDKEYAEDLTQETFIRFFTGLAAYRHRGKVKNYLYTIANHLCIDHLKKAREIPTEDGELTEKWRWGAGKGYGSEQNCFGSGPGEACGGIAGSDCALLF